MKSAHRHPTVKPDDSPEVATDGGRKTAHAYDPVRGESVTAGDCRRLHHDPEAVEEDPENDVVAVLDADFSHDPCEGCQGKYTLLVEGDCPECGSNRLERWNITLAGVGGVVCPACDHELVAP